VTVWLVTVIVFVLLRVVVPIVSGDVVDVIVGEYARHDEELQDQLRAEFGLDRNLFAQYWSWVSGLAQGDLGHSLYNGRSLVDEMKYRLPVSLELSLIGLTSAVALAIPMGVLAAVRQDEWPDYVLRIYAVGSNAVPGFWVAIMVITFGSLWFNWAPTVEYQPLWVDPVQHAKIMLVPALLIGLTPSGGLLRLMRAQMLEVLRQDYIRTARAKGLNERAVLARHATRNAIIPIVTVIGLIVPSLIAGTVLFEIIFVLPGMGLYLVNAVNNLDYPVIQATNLVFAVFIVLSNIIVDVSYAFIDPRIRY
jgi:peptide/nickel transport system permease protein